MAVADLLKGVFSREAAERDRTARTEAENRKRYDDLVERLAADAPAKGDTAEAVAAVVAEAGKNAETLAADIDRTRQVNALLAKAAALLGVAPDRLRTAEALAKVEADRDAAAAAAHRKLGAVVVAFTAFAESHMGTRGDVVGELVGIEKNDTKFRVVLEQIEQLDARFAGRKTEHEASAENRARHAKRIRTAAAQWMENFAAALRLDAMESPDGAAAILFPLRRDHGPAFEKLKALADGRAEPAA